MMEGINDPRTLVLVGKTGNGKSATGNSIIGNNKFCLNRYFSGGTTTSKLETRVMEDGQMLNVIDTPALSDSEVDDETVGKEIVRCIKMAVDGIHAFLLVYSLHNLFSDEDKAAISILKNLFGNQICDYMILVFTGGDELEEDGKTLEDFICECPQALKEILSLCGNRLVLFDNRTKDETKKANQVHELLSLVKIVVEKNGGQPYTNETFTEMKKWTREQTEEFHVLKDPEQQTLWRMEESHVEQMNPMVEMMHPLSLPFLELLAEILKDTDMVVVDRELREAYWEDFARKLSTAPDKQYNADWCRRTAWRLACFYQSSRKDLRENFQYRDLRKIFEGDSKIWEMLDVKRFFGRSADESSESDSCGFQDMVIRQPRYSTLHPETDRGVMTSLAQLAEENLVNLNDIACAQSYLSASSYAAFAFLNAKDNNTKADMIHSASLERKKRKYV